jgi:ubiquinone/menaquinone biosynthesis C-methylase UbiE
MMRSVEVHKVARPHAHLCPWWLGWVLLFPARRWFLNPERLIEPVVRAGDRVLEVGPGNGFVTLSIAERVGPQGQVFCVDVQANMIASLRRRLAGRGLSDRVATRVCKPDDLGVEDLSGSIDVAALIFMLHEAPDARRLLEQVAATLRPGGRLLLVEPKGHCPAELFARQIGWSRELGLRPSPQQPDYLKKLPQAIVMQRGQQG